MAIAEQAIIAGQTHPENGNGHNGHQEASAVEVFRLPYIAPQPRIEQAAATETTRQEIQISPFLRHAFIGTYSDQLRVLEPHMQMHTKKLTPAYDAFVGRSNPHEKIPQSNIVTAHLKNGGFEHFGFGLVVMSLKMPSSDPDFTKTNEAGYKTPDLKKIFTTVQLDEERLIDIAARDYGRTLVVTNIEDLQGAIEALFFPADQQKDIRMELAIRAQLHLMQYRKEMAELMQSARFFADHPDPIAYLKDEMRNAPPPPPVWVDKKKIDRQLNDMLAWPNFEDWGPNVRKACGKMMTWMFSGTTKPSGKSSLS